MAGARIGDSNGVVGTVCLAAAVPATIRWSIMLCVRMRGGLRRASSHFLQAV